eukprot:TRINITY_DN12720_c3_g1_i1.p1 TRINITY_DN12720_c3_g1~~TRINITY_DN12720_c3_g1_i1.p1  ORF type:complete len:269 (-),score=43.22 TRINITY_DN12720_c3_g1_i1:35-841(-)
MTNYNDPKKYVAGLRVVNTFFHIDDNRSAMIRCNSEPALSSRSIASDTDWTWPSTPSLPMSRTDTAPAASASPRAVVAHVADAKFAKDTHRVPSSSTTRLPTSLKCISPVAAAFPIDASAATASGAKFAKDPSVSLAGVRKRKEKLGLSPGDTTIMVRDLPCKVGYERMMTELKLIGLDGCYDYIYFPKSFHDKNSFKGFCFINFMTRGAIEIFETTFEEHTFHDINSTKTVRLGRADVQGLEANVALLRASRKRIEFKADPIGLRSV